MDLEILLASGETDTIRGADETLIEENYLHVLREIDGDEIPGSMKTITVTRPLDGDELKLWDNTEAKSLFKPAPGYLRPHLKPETKTQVYELVGTYAPGMWMKVMYS